MLSLHAARPISRSGGSIGTMSRMLRWVSMAGGSAPKPGGARRIGGAAGRSEDGVPGTADPAFFLLLLVAGGDFLAGQQAVGVGVPFAARVIVAEQIGRASCRERVCQYV